jgi:hypothetical protein
MRGREMSAQGESGEGCPTRRLASETARDGAGGGEGEESIRSSPRCVSVAQFAARFRDRRDEPFWAGWLQHNLKRPRIRSP